MTEATLLTFGCSVFFIFLSGCYVVARAEFIYDSPEEPSLHPLQTQPIASNVATNHHFKNIN